MNVAKVERNGLKISACCSSSLIDGKKGMISTDCRRGCPINYHPAINTTTHPEQSYILKPD